MAEISTPESLRQCTTKIVSGFLSHNIVEPTEIGTLISTVFYTLKHLKQPIPAPAVAIHQSIRPDVVICLECGFKAKVLRLHLHEVHHLTPNEYRTRWGLPSHYPLVAPNYAARRSSLAKQLGLGRYPRSLDGVEAETVEEQTSSDLTS